MIPVGLVRTRPDYAGLRPPFDAGVSHPEFSAWPAEAAGGAPNHVFAAVRSALFALGLDAPRFGSEDWNPLGSLVRRGGRIALKPNFIRHWNPVSETRPERGTLESVITHGAVLRAIADYAFLAAGPEGSVVVAEAPQHDCDFDRIREVAGLDALADQYRSRLGRVLEVVDLRRERVTYRDGVIDGRFALPGDPLGYRMIDLGRHSCFERSGLDSRRFRGADYDPGPTAAHHTGGRNEYLLSETVLSADLVVNLPKLKTHKKTGVTLSTKNLVGINGDKNLLPHHCVGSPRDGGDEYPGAGWLDAARSRATEVARGLLARGTGVRLVRWLRRAENAARGDDFVRSGNWHGNRTTWRMCIDLNRCLYYSDAKGEHFDAREPVRTVLTLIDGIVAGEGAGPLAPEDVPLGVVLASTDPIALDLTAVRLMGFDETRLPVVCEPMADGALRITRVRGPADVEVFEMDAESAAQAARRVARSLDAVRCTRVFEPHPGWRGHVERGAERGAEGQHVARGSSA